MPANKPHGCILGMHTKNNQEKMGFLKSLFGGKEESPEEKRKKEEARDFDVLKTDGVKALRMGRADYAVKCFEKALELRNDLETLDYLSQALIRNDQLGKALEKLAILAEAQPDNIHILLMMARVNYMMEDYNAMADVCERATLLDGDNAEVMFFYARASRGQGDLVNAVAMFSKCILLNPQFADAYLERGRLLLSMGDVEGASDDADYLMEVAEGVEDVMILKANVLEAKGLSLDALAIYDKIVETNPFSIVAYRGRGALKLAMGDKAGAEEDMKQLLELDPKALDDLSGTFKNS